MEMPTINRNKNNAVILAQVFIWAWLLLTPCLISLFAKNSFHASVTILLTTLKQSLPLLFIYLIDFIFLIPKWLFKGKQRLFVLVNLSFALLPIIFLLHGLLTKENISPLEKSWLYAAIGIGEFVIILCIGTAIGVRYIMRWNTLQMKIQEKKLQSAEAEVKWLKYQLNPHFLFNTLNNISSLTQIDADKAQDCIGQLSDLLRYAIYDSNLDLVPLKGEVDFMNNYIDLMRLRCNDMTYIEADLEKPEQDIKIAPLLFISLIENSFKHGVNARKESFIRFKLRLVGNNLVFYSENSCYPKDEGDRTGSGIGLENLQMRLELLYHDSYDYSHSVENGIYKVSVTIKDIIQNDYGTSKMHIS